MVQLFGAAVKHPRYGHPRLQLNHWQDKLYFCGTATAKVAGGIMEKVEDLPYK